MQAHIHARIERGCLPEEVDGKACSSHGHVVFCRDTSDSTEYRVKIDVGSDLTLDMNMADFTEAFLAVVPRWFWQPKDER